MSSVTFRFQVKDLERNLRSINYKKQLKTYLQMKQATALIATIACAQALTLSTETTLSVESTLSTESTAMTLPEAHIATGPYYWGPDYPFPGFNNI